MWAASGRGTGHRGRPFNKSLEVISASVPIFRKEPSTALKSGVLAAVASWIVVAAFNIGDCFSQSASCILASPALWVYWAPVFLALWFVFALWLRGRKDRNDF